MPSPREVALSENDRSKFEKEPQEDAGATAPGASGEPRERDVSVAVSNPPSGPVPATNLQRK